jgi:hypothetical protein
LTFAGLPRFFGRSGAATAALTGLPRFLAAGWLFVVVDFAGLPRFLGGSTAASSSSSTSSTLSSTIADFARLPRFFGGSTSSSVT